jgi:GrpB-like predicted nucleotidyltransferase (UPF0157 family)
LAGRPTRIEHVGSTAVPDLSAKPIIDIMVGLAADHDLDVIVTRLQGLGYSYIARYEIDGNPMPFRRYFRNQWWLPHKSHSSRDIACCPWALESQQQSMLSQETTQPIPINEF